MWRMAILFLLLGTYGGLSVFVVSLCARAIGLGGDHLAIDFIVASALVALPFVVRRLERARMERWARLAAWIGYPWMGFAFLAGIMAAVIAILATTFPHALLPSLASPAGARLVLALALALSLYAFYERSTIRVERLIIEDDKLAGHRPIRIAQISDVHIGLMNGRPRIRRIVKALSATAPDVIVSTGDLMDANLASQKSLAALFNDLRPPLGAYAILGNHECYAGIADSVQFMEAAGFTVLRNERRQVGAVTIIGVDDPAAPRTRARRDTERALFEEITDTFTILLKHRPELSTRADLQLSGHTHKGQIFPFGLVTRLQYRQNAGLFETASGRLYVSRGTGAWGPPFRLLAPPEVTVIELRPPQAGTEPPAIPALT